MNQSMEIALQNVRLRAFHGLYAEERKAGNDFVVNMKVCYSPNSVLIESIEDTLDYVQLFSIVKTIMAEPVDLLETVVQKMAIETKKQFPYITSLWISVEKLNPPIYEFKGSTVVSISQQF